MTRKKRRALLCMLAVPLLALAPRSEESLPASAAEPAAMPEKYVALTFDDGPWPETTEQLLDGLAERGAKATFFLIGEQIAGHEDTVRRMADEGHQVGSHTFTHMDLSRGDPAERLRAVYPNLLHVEVAARRREDEEEAEEAQPIRTPGELFAAFYKEMTGADLTAAQEAALADSLQAAQTAGEEGSAPGNKEETL